MQISKISLPFRGPLALVRPYVIAVTKVIIQSKEHRKLDDAIESLNKSIPAIIRLINDKEDQLWRIINQAPHPLIEKDLQMRIDIPKWQEWLIQLKPVLKEARKFIYDYPTIRDNLVIQKQTIEKKFQELENKKKKSIWQKGLKGILELKNAYYSCPLFYQIQDIDRAEKLLEHRVKFATGMIPEDEF